MNASSLALRQLGAAGRRGDAAGGGMSASSVSSSIASSQQQRHGEQDHPTQPQSARSQTGMDSSRSNYSATEEEVGAAGALPLRTPGSMRSAEEEDALGVAKDSRYHAPPPPGTNVTPSRLRGRAQAGGAGGGGGGGGGSNSSSLALLRRAGASTSHDDYATLMDIGTLDSMPFAPPGQHGFSSPSPSSSSTSGASAKAGGAAAGMGMGSGGAFMQPGEARLSARALALNQNNHFAIHASQQQQQQQQQQPQPQQQGPGSAPGSQGQLSARTSRGFGIGEMSSASFGSTSDVGSVLGPNSASEERRREWRRSQEAKEEAAQYDKIRGGPLLDFARGTSAGGGGGGFIHLGSPPPGHASAALAASAAAVAAVRPGVKPYVRYMPKFNLPYGDAPRQVPQPPPAAAAAATAPPAATAASAAAPAASTTTTAAAGENKAREGSSDGAVLPSDHPPPQPQQQNLASVRSTTMFNLSGALNTHVGISLNESVFLQHNNADNGGSAGSGAGAGGVPPIAGRRSAGGTRPATGTGSATGLGRKSDASILSSRASATGSVSGSTARPGSSGSAAPASSTARTGSASSLSRATADGTGGASGSGADAEGEEPDGTFLTGVSLSESQSHSHRPTASSQSLQVVGGAPSSSSSHVVTVGDLRAFDALPSVEQAVRFLPRLLRPTLDSIRAVESIASSTVRSKEQRALLPPLPMLDLPARVNLPELMRVALRMQPASTGGSGGGSASSPLHQHQAALNRFWNSEESVRIVKDTYYFVLLYFFKPAEPAQQLAGGRGRRNGGGNAGGGGGGIGQPLSTENEMYLYSAYASNLKKYAEQEGFLQKQREWARECERLRQAERDSHMQIGTQATAAQAQQAQAQAAQQAQATQAATASGGAAAAAGAGGAATAASATAAAASSTASNPNGVVTSNSASGGPAGSPHVLPSTREELLLPPAPVQTPAQKRQPLVLLGDIPHFDVQARLNTGPVPKRLFAIAPPPGSASASGPCQGLGSSSSKLLLTSGGSGVPSSPPDYSSSSFLLSSLQSRISSSFVSLFLRIPPAQKDAFYARYNDLLAQTTYYAFLVAYPDSRKLVNHRFFKVRLLQLTAFWITGFVPSGDALDATIGRWAGDIQFMLGEVGLNPEWTRKGADKRNNHTGGSGGGEADASSTAFDGIDGADQLPSRSGEDRDRVDHGGGGSGGAGDDEEEDPDLLGSSSPGGGGGGASSSGGGAAAGGGSHGAASHPSNYVSQLEKKLNAHLAASSKNARQAKAAAAAQQQQQQLSHTQTLLAQSLQPNQAYLSPFAPLVVPNQTSSVASLPTSTASSVAGSPKGSRPPAAGAADSLPGASATTIISQLSSTTHELTGDLLVDVGERPRRGHARVPLRVTRRKVELHHSALVQDFIEARHFSRQSNHALRIPISVPAVRSGGGDGMDGGDAGDLLDNLAAFNEARRADTAVLKAGLAASKAQFARQAARHKKEVAEIQRKFDQERERALREAPAFSKTLVAEHEERRYQDLKAPSKSLALRRLGHFRQTKEEGRTTISSNSETSATLIKSALMM